MPFSAHVAGPTARHSHTKAASIPCRTSCHRSAERIGHRQPSFKPRNPIHSSPKRSIKRPPRVCVSWVASTGICTCSPKVHCYKNLKSPPPFVCLGWAVTFEGSPRCWGQSPRSHPLPGRDPSQCRQTHRRCLLAHHWPAKIPDKYLPGPPAT